VTVDTSQSVTGCADDCLLMQTSIGRRLVVVAAGTGNDNYTGTRAITQRHHRAVVYLGFCEGGRDGRARTPKAPRAGGCGKIYLFPECFGVKKPARKGLKIILLHSPGRPATI